VIFTGVDIVDVTRLEAVLARWPRLADRLFTPAEQAYAAGHAHPSQSLAARFAAKEAAMKALGAGWPQVSWLDVEVRRGTGRPELVLSGRAAELAAGGRCSVSLAHDAGVAVASVILERP
jgi:holo-[acyl-carrier protein] synthase